MADFLYTQPKSAEDLKVMQSNYESGKITFEQARGMMKAANADPKNPLYGKVEQTVAANQETPKSTTNPNAKTGPGAPTTGTSQPGPSASQSSFNISQFRSEIQNNGVLPVNRFLVVFSPPRSLGTTEKLTMRCENATIPGINFFTSQTTRYGYGQVERRPYIPTFNPITLSFIVDAKSTVIDFFNIWTNSIVNYDVSKGMYSGAPSPYLMSYKDDYISKQMQIYVYDYENKKQVKVTLYDAYPLSTSDISLGWGQNDEVMKYSVSLQYTHMTIESSQPMETQKIAQTLPLNFAIPESQEVKNAKIKEIQNLEKKLPNVTNLDTTGSNLSAVDAARFTLYNGVPNPTLKI